MNREVWLEQQMNRDDLSDEEFNMYNRELNELQVGINLRKARIDELIEAKRKQEQEEADLQFIESLTEESVEKMYIDSCLKYQDVNGMSFQSWYEQSLKYYTIDANNVVHSKARSPNTTDSVPCMSLAHAKYRILCLIRTKFYDHAHRGYDFAWT